MASMTEVMRADQMVCLKGLHLASMTEAMMVDQMVRLTGYLMASMTEVMRADQMVRLKGYPKEYLMVSERDSLKGSLTVMMMEVNLG